MSQGLLETARKTKCAHDWGYYDDGWHCSKCNTKAPDSGVCMGCGCQHHRCACEHLDRKDPNGAHAIEFGKLCKCGSELCHPGEIKMDKCYPCKAKEVDLADEKYLGDEAYARGDYV